MSNKKYDSITNAVTVLLLAVAAFGYGFGKLIEWGIKIVK